MYLVTISSLILVGSIQTFSELEEYEDLQIYGVFAVMACCTLVVVTLMQIVVLSQNAHIKNQMTCIRSIWLYKSSTMSICFCNMKNCGNSAMM